MSQSIHAAMRSSSTRIVSLLMVLIGAWLAVAASAQPLDVHLTDARLDTLLQQESLEALEEAASVYLDLISRVGTALTPDERIVLNHHMAQLALILPTSVQAQVADGDLRQRPERATFKTGAGEVLARWWRSQDPLPASPQNERLAEHLQRVAVAEAQFAYEARPTGFDDRGSVYVRYGRPSRESVIRFDDPRLIDEVYQPGVAVSPSDFPDNAFWRYLHVDRAGYFLFVKKTGHYQLGTTEDLLPPVLRYGFDAGGRGQRKTDMTLAVMRSIYRQLALEHPDFAVRFSDVDLYASDREQTGRLRTRDASGNNRAIVGMQGTGRTADQAGQQGSDIRPHQLKSHEFARSLLDQGKIEDAQAVYRRETSMPEHYTEVFRETQILPLSIRTARFLDDDGTTRTEIYWSPEPGGLRFKEKKKKRANRALDIWSPDQFLVHMAAIQQTADYQPRKTNRKPYLITDLPNVTDVAIPTQTMIVRGDTGMYHLALQWDQHQALAREAGGLQVGPQVKIATYHADSLHALNADERVLEISDLKPVFVNDLAALYDGAPGEPYPHPQIWPELPLGLYFEVYHLTFDDDDQTHYTITYEIAGVGARGLLRFLGRGDQERTAVETPSTGQSRTAREYVVLDLSEWEGVGVLEVRLHVADDVTGSRVARSLLFELVD